MVPSVCNTVCNREIEIFLLWKRGKLFLHRKQVSFGSVLSIAEKVDIGSGAGHLCLLVVGAKDMFSFCVQQGNFKFCRLGCMCRRTRSGFGFCFDQILKECRLGNKLLLFLV